MLRCRIAFLSFGPAIVTTGFQTSVELSCFHCGQPVPAGTALFVSMDGIPRQVCCAGCQAVSEAIIVNGLADYYRHRAALPERPEEALPAELQELGLFDHPNFQQSFVRPLVGDEREADLILEGITCAACVWLNERHLTQLPGVSGVQVNYATRRARIRWHEGEIRLSTILAAVASIGYRAHPYDPLRSEELAQRERRSALWRLFVSGFGMMQVMMYAVPVYMAGEGEMSVSVESLMRWASLLLTLPVVFYAAAPFFQRALRDLRLRRVGMDVPVALGVGFAFVASVWATLAGAGDVYFDSVSMFVFFLLGGRYLEMLARQRAMRGAEMLGRLLPSFARRLTKDGGVEERVPANLLVVGDRVLVRPGETIVADGVVRAGHSEVNEAWLTGESAPVLKAVGATVLGGSLNGSGVLEVEAQQVGETTRLATIRRLMERAAAERPKVVEQADRIAGVFTLVLLGLALLSGMYWWQADAARAVPVFVAVLVVSCPCALSLATPVALTVATDAFARAGLLVTRGHAIEALARAGHFVFDKTGTLTTGALRLEEVVCAEGVAREQALSLAAALELHSEHVIARALVLAAGENVCAATRLEIRPGQGLTGRIDGEPHALGCYEHAARLAASDLPFRLVAPEGRTIVYLARQGQWLAAFALADSLRPSAYELVKGLREAGCGVSIFSGDAQPAVAAVAETLGVMDAKAGLAPEGKHAALQALQGRGAVVAMVGDGINDAPVLAQAHVSIAMAGGTELARNQGDILLLNDELGRLLLGRRLAHKTLAVIRENLAWALAYNLLAIPAAMLGWVTPWIAGIGMGLSSLLVVLNALRIARVR
ncbi:heavy metal translocating P-type ATPase [Uliginosibacterium sp. 31-16]|uniref:heavy metal translocating P-type ATPase n=1 Tax=Uliginosibacterium sp. 31-16 TaxID=3068315 RepID=UPI00273D3488|nr:heavy metal translocating P-type ATPase [Uliginosibacterium sp. 31-16]MDP5240133.1 heavy metal translocating P-type ATPase [Uliginosibacterium sp. 31-16]